MTASERWGAARAAQQAGDWDRARADYEGALGGSGLPVADEPTARFGLARVLWWLGETKASVAEATRAYALCRTLGDVAGATETAVWLAITYTANFDNAPATAGWLGRADRLLEGTPWGALHAWVMVARAYATPDLDEAEQLTQQAWETARSVGDADLEVVALSQLGLVRVSRGRRREGFALIDEAMTAALAGEGSSMDTVVYACCDMLRACEVAGDVERATQWCAVADDVVAKYGCPFLGAECRLTYGSVLAATGRWSQAERELAAALRIAQDSSPRLHASGLARLAGLRVRQGRLEQAGALLEQPEAEGLAEADHAVSRAALLLARGDGAGAARVLSLRLGRMGVLLGTALDLLVDASLASDDVAGAEVAVTRLTRLATETGDPRLGARAAAVRGRVAAAHGDTASAESLLCLALAEFAQLRLPFEGARTRADLAELTATTDPDSAVEHAQRAWASFTELGARVDADRVAAILRRLGVRARTGPKGVGTLTVREQEVLRLLAAGLTNPEIAARLHISRKTAAHHVSHILDKLALRNRAEAAAYAMRMP